MTNDIAYENYCRVRDAVYDMMASDMSDANTPSEYWLEEINGFDYLFEAPPRLIWKLREHCYHITGLHSYTYRHHHDHKKGPFVGKLKALRALDKTGLWVPESPLLGGFGHQIDDQLVNLDTLKFYESLIAMDKAGLIRSLRNMANRPIALEIGAGWGGFAYQIKTLLPNLTYVIVDLPPTLIFSATYLSTLFPQAKIYLYSPETIAQALSNIDTYDFVFLPNYIIKTHQLPGLDLAINMVSFQEMTDAQVGEYVGWLWAQGCPYLYSHNRGKSPHNPELSSVDALLNKAYTLERINVLPVPYTNLRETSPGERQPLDPKSWLRRVVKTWLTSRPLSPQASLMEYRHLVGTRKTIPDVS